MSDLNAITAVILAGGLGTRLRSIVADRPKVLAPVNGRPFLSYLLDQLVSLEIQHVVLCVGYLGNLVYAEFGGSYGPLTLEYSQEKELLGTGGALRQALPLFHSETVLVMNGDSYCHDNLGLFCSWYHRRMAKAALFLTKVNNANRYGQVMTDKFDRIIQFTEKGELEGPGWINAGIYLLDYHVVETIPPLRQISLEREMFPIWVDQGLDGYHGQGTFLDIGIPADYAQAGRFFSGRHD